MPWSSDPAEMPPVRRRVRPLLLALAAALAVAVSYWGAIWFVSFDCLRTRDDRAVSICPSVRDMGWIDSGTRMRIDKRLARAQISTEKYADALTTIDRIEAHGPLGFNEVKHRYTALYFTGQKDAALKDMELALQLRPKDATALNDYALTAHELGKMDEARKAFEILSAFQPENVSVLLSLSDVAYRQGDTAKAAEIARKGLALDAENAGLHNMLALALEKDGKLDEALQLYGRAIAAAPDNKTYYVNRAMLHYDRGDLAAARSDYEASLPLGRGVDNLHGLAQIALDQDRYDEGRVLLDEALALAPGDEAVHRGKGRYHFLTGEYAEARKHFERAKQILPDNDFADYWLASTDHAEGNAAKALPEYRRLLNVWPENTTLHNDIGVALLDLERPNEAIEVFTACIALDGVYANCWENRSRAHVRSGKYEEAAADAGRAIALLPGKGWPYTRRAYANWWLGRLDEARKDYDRATELSPDVKWIASERAEFLIFAGTPEEGRAALDQLKANGASPGDLLKYEGRLAEAAGNYEEAVGHYRQALALAPDDPWRHEDLAWSLLDADRLVEGLEVCEAMQKLAPDEYASHRCRSRAYRYMRNYELALEADNAAHALAPDNNAVNLDRSYDLMILQRWDEAIAGLTPLVRRGYQPELTRYYRGLSFVETRQPELALKDFRAALEHAKGQLAKDIAVEVNRLEAKTGGGRSSAAVDYPQFRPLRRN